MENNKINAAFFTGGKNVPSARFRVRQYLRLLDAYNIQGTEYSSYIGKYPPKSKLQRFPWLFSALIERASQIPLSYINDVTIFQRELISSLTTFEPFFAHPNILDVDDAIWLHRNGKFSARLAKTVDAVICGNHYLADYFNNYNQNITIIPTAVDARNFKPNYDSRSQNSNEIIGWSGSSTNLSQIEQLEPVFREIFKVRKGSKLRIICDKYPSFNSLPSERVEFIQWSPDTEVRALQDLSVGLMPLSDTHWNRGKCSFKMLTYMACGIPVVVSPVGMNSDVLAKGQVGLAAKNHSDWVQCIIDLLTNPRKALDMGISGREIIESHYSTEVLAQKLACTIRNVATEGR